MSTCTGRSKVVVFPRIGGTQWVTTIESTLWGTEEHGARRGGCPGSHPWSCGDHAGILCNTRFIKGHKLSNHIRARIKSHIYTTE